MPALSLMVVAASVVRADLPPGFTDSVVVAGGWNQAVGVTFDDANAAWVWEKGGRVWRSIDGRRPLRPVLDLTEEVGDWRDFGLLGFALDPDFTNNGYIYALYTVDYHHLRYFGTPQYNPATNEYFRDTIGRVTRYHCSLVNGVLRADPASRRVLLGESMSTGIPCVHLSHHVGTLMFGADGSLLVTAGDGASYEEMDNGGPRNGSSHTALADGIITPAEDVGAFRSQLVTSLSGKVLRIDPATGDGLPGNPFFSTAEPRSARSRVYALGFRNPFRACVRPGTGGPGTGPGVLYIGDVGWYQREEVNVVRTPGENCGWPLFEGLRPSASGYVEGSPLNLDATNPLFDGASCAQRFFNFRSLIVQDTLGVPSWPNPCDAAAQVPALTPRFRHTRPAIEYGHGGTTRVGTFHGDDADEMQIDAVGSPVAGAPFAGDCVCGGVWITHPAFPPAWRNRYYCADFVGGVIRAMTFDEHDTLRAVTPFQTAAGPVVCLAAGRDGFLYYINYDQNGVSNLRRIAFGSDAPPTAAAAATPRFGALPLTVHFSSAGSADPEGRPLAYAWDFGDGQTSADANPTHTYTGDRDITAQGTFIARVLTLDPPGPQGHGSRDPETVRDGVYPAAHGVDASLQYDTFHSGDQGDDDWFGWSFDRSWRFTALDFEEGMNYTDGGWFDTRRVEVRGDDGLWRQVRGMTFSPAYFRNDGVSFDRFRITFEAAVGTGIRLRGNPGGSGNYTSVAELRALAQPVDNASPQRFDATLTVTDAVGQTATAGLLVSPNNTPPVVRITSPVDGGIFNDMVPQLLPLHASVTDAEHDPSQMLYRWDVALHHDEHTHPEPPIFERDAEVRIEGHGDTGDRFSWAFDLTVTDPMGLAAVAHAEIFPNPCPADFNADGFVDFFDYLAFTDCFEGEACPPGASADANHDGFADFFDYDSFVGAFQTGC